MAEHLKKSTFMYTSHGRWGIRRTTGSISEMHLPDYPAHLTAISGQLAEGYRVVSRSLPGRNHDASALIPCA
jgi:hypothetical protein